MIRPIGHLRIFEGCRIVRHIFITCICGGLALIIVTPIVPSIVAAEGSIKRDLVIFEMAVDVACALKISLRCAPSRWIRRDAGRNVRRYTASRKEPDTYVVRSPFGCKNAAVLVVKLATVCLWVILNRSQWTQLKRQSAGAGLYDAAA